MVEEAEGMGGGSVVVEIGGSTGTYLVRIVKEVEEVTAHTLAQPTFEERTVLLEGIARHGGEEGLEERGSHGTLHHHGVTACGKGALPYLAQGTLQCHTADACRGEVAQEDARLSPTVHGTCLTLAPDADEGGEGAARTALADLTAASGQEVYLVDAIDITAIDTDDAGITVHDLVLRGKGHGLLLRGGHLLQTVIAVEKRHAPTPVATFGRDQGAGLIGCQEARHGQTAFHETAQRSLIEDIGIEETLPSLDIEGEGQRL